MCLKEQLGALFGPKPIECPERPPDNLDIEMFQVHFGRIAALLADTKQAADAYAYLVGWDDPVLTSVSLLVFLVCTLRFDTEYIGSLPFAFLVAGMARLAYLRLTGEVKDRFVGREKDSRVKVSVVETRVESSPRDSHNYLFGLDSISTTKKPLTPFSSLKERQH